MKYAFCFLFLIGILSCNNEDAQPIARPKLVPKDSTLANTETINPYAPIDVSPMDMSYFPEDFPVLKMSGKAASLPISRVVYSRPHRQGRKIFDGLLKYGEPWRLGANEATEIEFFGPVSIQNKKIPKGEYNLYCIPYQDKWTIIFNSNLYTWGLKPDPSKDLYKFDIPIEMKAQSIEYFSIIFQKADGGTNLVMAWDNVEAKLLIQYTPEK